MYARFPLLNMATITNQSSPVFELLRGPVKGIFGPCAIDDKEAAIIGFIHGTTVRAGTNLHNAIIHRQPGTGGIKKRPPIQTQ